MGELVKVTIGLRISIPRRLAKLVGIKEGDYVLVELKEDSLVITRAKVIPMER